MAEEAGELYVKLAADIADLKSGVDEALSELGSFAKKTDKITKEASSSWSTFIADVEKSKFAFAAVSGAITGAAGLTLKAFADQEIAVANLAGALANQGVVAKDVIGDLEAYASQLQNTSRFGDSAIMSMQTLMVNYGVTGDELKTLTKSTLDFAAATGKDLPMAAKLVGGALTGEAGELRRYGVEIDRAMSRTEILTKVMGGLGQFSGRAELQTKTLAGQMSMLGNAVGDITKTVGAFLANEAKFFVTMMTEWSQKILAFIEANPAIVRLTIILAGLVAAFAGLVAGAGVFIAYVKGPLLAVVAILSSKFVLIAAVIAGVGLVIAAIVTDFMGLRQSILNILGALITITNPFVNLFQVLFPGLIRSAATAIADFIAGIFTSGSEVNTWLSTFINTAWTMIKGVFDWILSIAGFLLPESVKTAITAMGANIVNAAGTIKTEIGTIKDAFGTALGESRAAFFDASGLMVTTATDSAISIDTIQQELFEKEQERVVQDKENKWTALEEIKDWSEKTYDALNMQQETWASIGASTVNQVTSGFGRAMGDMIVSGGRFSDAMKRLWKDIARQVIAAIAQMIVKWLVFMALTGGKGAAFVKVAGAMKDGGLITEPSLITGLRSGVTHVAGESGPEAVVPLTGGKRVAGANREADTRPSESGGMDAGMNITVNVSGHFIEGNESTWQRLVRDKIVPEIQRFTMTNPTRMFNRRRGATA